jgi:hypothetical protein
LPGAHFPFFISGLQPLAPHEALAPRFIFGGPASAVAWPPGPVTAFAVAAEAAGGGAGAGSGAAVAASPGGACDAAAAGGGVAPGAGPFAGRVSGAGAADSDFAHPPVVETTASAARINSKERRGPFPFPFPFRIRGS